MFDWLAPSVIYKYLTLLERIAKEKSSSLFSLNVSGKGKQLNKIATGAQMVKKFTVVI